MQVVIVPAFGPFSTAGFSRYCSQNKENPRFLLPTGEYPSCAVSNAVSVIFSSMLSIFLPPTIFYFLIATSLKQKLIILVYIWHILTALTTAQTAILNSCFFGSVVDTIRDPNLLQKAADRCNFP